jgi:hypothetical protein
MYFQVNRYYIFMHPLNNLLRAQDMNSPLVQKKHFFILIFYNVNF